MTTPPTGLSRKLRAEIPRGSRVGAWVFALLFTAAILSAPVTHAACVPLGGSGTQIVDNTGTSGSFEVVCGVLSTAPLWFQYSACSNGVFTFDTIGSAIDTVLAVFTGTNVLNLQLVACDDDSAPDGLRSVVTFNAMGGQAYYVLVDGVDDEQGVMHLNHLLVSTNCVAPTAGLVAWWPGDGNANDIAGTNRGTLKNGAAFVAGEVRAAFSFDGVDDFVAIPDSPVWDFGTNSFTIEFWARLDAIKPSMFLHQQSGADVGGFEFRFSGEGGLVFGLNSVDAADSATWIPQINVWTHLAVTRSNHTFRIFVNGAQALNSGHINPNPVANVSGMVRLGSYAVAGYEMAGALDEVSVYHRALSGTEIRDIYGAGTHGKCRIPLETLTFKLWDRSFGGLAADNYPIIRHTVDGGFVLAGATASGIGGNKATPICGTVAAWIVKLDAAGNKQWEQTVGAPGDTLYIVTLEATSDGGYVLGASSAASSGALGSGNCGKISPNFGAEDFWLVRLDAAGQRLWDASYGGDAGDYLEAIARLDDGGFILAGSSFSGVSGNKTSANLGLADFWVVRVDAVGNKLWDRSFGGTEDDSALSVAVTADGGFLVSGNSASESDADKTAPNYGLQDFWVVRLDASGDKLWDQSYGGDEDESGGWMTPTPDGGAVLAGFTLSPISGTRTAPNWGGLDFWVVRIDADGDQLWDRSFGGSGDYDWAYNVKAAADGGVIVIGESDSGIDGNKTTVHFGNSDGWVVRLDPWGAKVAECSLGGTDYDYLWSADTVGAGGFILAGGSYSDPGGNKTAPNFGDEDVWVVRLAERIAPVGMPVILVNGLFSPTNFVTVTNSALIQIQSTFSNGPIFYTLNGAPPSSGTQYTGPFVLNQSATIRAIAFNVAGAASPEVAPLNVAVIAPPNIVLQPQDQTVGAGADAMFAALAAGTSPLNFQWLRDGVPVPGATNAVLLLTNVPPAPPANFVLVVGNAFGMVTSAVARLIVLAPPTIITQPVSATVSVGGSVMFSVSAFGPPPLQFQWRKNGVNIPGAIGSTLTVTNVQIDDGASYTVVIASPGGTLVSNPAQLNVTVPSPAANDNFAAAAALTGASGAASGTNNFTTRQPDEPLHAGKQGSNSVWYAWTAPAQGIATFRTTGSTFDTLLAVYTGTSVSSVTHVASDEDSGGFLTSQLSFNATNGVTYRIAIDGFGGQQGHFLLRWKLEQTNATQPVITCHPANRTVPAGAGASFNVSATGNALTYRWLFNGVELAGETSASLSISNVQRPRVGFYFARVTGAGNRSVDSLPAILEIGPFPNVQSREKPDDTFPTCAGGFAPVSGGSVAMGSIGSQIIVGSYTNSALDCVTTNCGGIPTGIRYIDYTAPANATFVFDTVGSVPRTKLWICRLGASTLDARSVIKCDISSAPDGRSVVRFPAEAGISYRAILAKLDDVSLTPQLNWKFGVPPVLTSVSPNRFLEAGSSLSLNAAAQNVMAAGVTSPLPPPIYRWFFNNTLLGTGPALTLPNVTAAQAGLYRVDVSNDLGSTSAVVRVEVYGAPTRAVVSTGGVTELFADATTDACGTVPATYQWHRNGTLLSGETRRNLVLPATQPENAGEYKVTVVNCFGSVTYTAAHVAVTVDVGFQAELLPGGPMVLRWRTTPGKHYRVEFRPSFDASAWMPLLPDILATGGMQTITNPLGPVPRFYRIVLLD